MSLKKRDVSNWIFSHAGEKLILLVCNNLVTSSDEIDVYSHKLLINKNSAVKILYKCSVVILR